MTTNVTLDERQEAYGFSGQSSVQKTHSPVMHNTGVNSIQLEKFHHIETQTKYSNEDPSMRSEEESSKPDIDLSKNPSSKRDVEVNQKDVRISEEKSSFDKVIQCILGGSNESFY